MTPTARPTPVHPTAVRLTRSANPPFHPERTALVVVDMQGYFLDPGHAFGRFMKRVNAAGVSAFGERVEGLVLPNIQRLQAAFRAARAHLFYTEMGAFRADRQDMPGWARRQNEIGVRLEGEPLFACFDEPSCRIDPRLAPAPGEQIFQKTTSGLLASTTADQSFRVLGIDTVVLCGVLTDVCVTQAARELGDRDFEALVVGDACAALDERVHQAALDTVAMTFGRVLSTDQILEGLSAPA